MCEVGVSRSRRPQWCVCVQATMLKKMKRGSTTAAAGAANAAPWQCSASVRRPPCSRNSRAKFADGTLSRACRACHRPRRPRRRYLPTPESGWASASYSSAAFATYMYIGPTNFTARLCVPAQEQANIDRVFDVRLFTLRKPIHGPSWLALKPGRTAARSNVCVLLNREDPFAKLPIMTQSGCASGPRNQDEPYGLEGA